MLKKKGFPSQINFNKSCRGYLNSLLEIIYLITLEYEIEKLKTEIANLILLKT